MKEYVRIGYMEKGEHEMLKLIELGGKWGKDGKRQCSTMRPIGMACGRSTNTMPPCAVAILERRERV